MSTGYQPQAIEQAWTDRWIEAGVFRSVPDDREPFTIVIPPPNVTGVLHMGHMLNNTIQDVLVRRARMQGYNACWVPGTDHASIATEAKVVKKLRADGVSKYDIGREAFMEHAFAWKEEYGDIILDQLKRLGASCDWERTRFTMEESLSRAVTKVFVDLYDQGLIYRDWKIVNWDPTALTTLSNEEVVRKDVESTLYHVAYEVVETGERLTIATTRPETIMGDTAVCVHPDDARYTHLHGKTVRVPLVDREVPIITDTYIDMEFGTGVLKVTPAHDPNDYEIGRTHDLETIDVFNPDGSLSEAARVFVGMDRFEARTAAAKALDETGLLVRTETIQNNVGYSERNPETVVEPRLSLQWFVKMDDLAKPALENVLNGDIDFVPPRYVNVYKHWLENIRDWPISRQLWWGHRIPAWYDAEGGVHVARTAEEALEKARTATGRDLGPDDLTQDEDALDTWFSSWLWPITVFDGMEDGGSPDFDYYYPTNVLVTGWDIIFFWVARMIFAGYAFTDQKPFQTVYFTGMVRDMQRRKMSKSLGNSPDALHLMDEYGADGVRFGVLSCAAAGNDLLFEEQLCRNGRNFANKIWNAWRLVEGWEVRDGDDDANHVVIHWFRHRLDEAKASIGQSMDDFRLSEALMTLHQLIWTDFCSWYLEWIKPAYGEPVDATTRSATIDLLDELLRLLHPFMPFLTEELWQTIRDRDNGDFICTAPYPVAGDFDATLVEKVGYVQQIVTNLRDLRAQNNLKKADAIKVYLLDGEGDLHSGWSEAICKLTGAETFEVVDAEVAGADTFIVKGRQFYVDLGIEVDVEAQRAELTEELDYAKGFVASVRKKLDNERFVQNAPEAVVAKERQKLKDGTSKVALLEERLKALG